MALRFRLVASPESIQDFELSARQKYWAGIELALTGHEASAVYLLGYVAEMLLKNACFRVDGARPADPVAPYLGPSRNWMRVYYPNVDHEGYHNVWFWVVLLRHKRRHFGLPFAEIFDQTMLRHCRNIYRNWWVNMRYRADVPQAAELSAVYNGVSWLFENQLALWR